MLKKNKTDRSRPYVVYGKFENTAGDMVLEQWTGRVYKMSAAMRLATTDFWKRKSVRWRHHVLAVLSVQPLSEREYKERTKKGRAA